MDNTIGAIGFVSRIIPTVYPISIIKVDSDGEPIRNAKGLCQECKPSTLKAHIPITSSTIYLRDNSSILFIGRRTWCIHW